MRAEYQRLDCWLQSYLAHLQAAGYSSHTIAKYRARLQNLKTFLDVKEMSVDSLQAEATLDTYLEHWLHNSPGRFLPMPRTRTRARSILQNFVNWTRQEGHLPPTKEASAPELLTGYLEFLTQHRGASQQTVQNYNRYLTSLVSFLEERGRRDLSGIPIELFDDYIAQRGRPLGRGGLCILISALRGFLKYLFFIGAEPDDRSDWLTFPTKFSKMKLPRDIKDEHLAAALESVNRTTVVGKRDWAILMVLTNYGLRVSEAARICLDDLDFESRHIEIRRSKQGPRQVFPLVTVVAIALKEYISVRPKTQYPQVFLRMIAPIRPLSRTGLANRVHWILSSVPGAPRRGAHALRHTLARKIREEGKPLPVISQVLGHRHLDSTEAYLRISVDELREVADNYAELL